MANVTAAMVKALRERTGLGMMECKNVLVETDGDIDLAETELRKRSATKAAKKSDRTAAEGLLGLSQADGKVALVEVNIETDFAAKNEQFIAFVARVADHVLSTGQTTAEELDAALGEERQTMVQSIGENITLRRAAYFAAQGNQQIGTYLHSDNRKAALVLLDGGSTDVARDVAMHVTAVNPAVISPADVDPALIAKEREIFVAQAAESGKPPEIVEKMVDGRVRKFLAEISLVEQPFVKDPNMKVSQLLKDNDAACANIVRFEVGEGIEVEETDFAAEVAAQLKSDD